MASILIVIGLGLIIKHASFLLSCFFLLFFLLVFLNLSGFFFLFFLSLLSFEVLSGQFYPIQGHLSLQLELIGKLLDIYNAIYVRGQE